MTFSDRSALHWVLADEFDNLTEKTTPHNDDRFLLEDSEDDYEKKYVLGSNLPGGGGGGVGGSASYSETIGDNSETEYTVTHNLNTTDLVVQLWDLTGTDPIEATGDASSIEAISADAIEVTFSAAPPVDSYRVVILSDGGTGGGGGVGGWGDPVVPSNGPGGDSDEFDAGDLSAYTAVTVSGNATWSRLGDAAVVKYNTQTSPNAAALLKPLPGTPSTGLKVWTAGRSLMWNNQFGAIGVVLTDGTTSAANSVAATWFTNASNVIRVMAGTLSNLNGTADLQRAIAPSIMLPYVGLRMTWTAANTFRGEYSPYPVDDDVAWSDFGLGTLSKTMTPTHYGLLVTSLSASGTTDRLAAFEFLRHDN